MLRRLPTEQLFRVGAEGLEDISDDTLRRRLDDAGRQALRRQSDPGYRAAVAEEMLQLPESV